MWGLPFLKRNFSTILKDIQPIKNLKNETLKQFDRLEITIYNPNSRFNKSIFRTHKYECKICYMHKNIYIEDNTFGSLIDRINGYIKDNYYK